MAAKKKGKMEAADAPLQEQPQPTRAKPDGPIPGTVRLVNLTPVERDITLTDGTNLHLWPGSKHGRRHVSRPVLKKLLPPPVRKMAVRGEIRIEEVAK